MEGNAKIYGVMFLVSGFGYTFFGGLVFHFVAWALAFNITYFLALFICSIYGVIDPANPFVALIFGGFFSLSLAFLVSHYL